MLLTFLWLIPSREPKLELYQKHRTVVSISTFGGRTQALEKAIDSVLDQTVRIDKIYIQLPLELKRVKSQEIDPLVYELPKKDPRIQILHPEDYGPSTKLLGALLVEEDPDTVIVTLDDDTRYHREMIHYLLQHLEQEDDQIPCFVCEHWPFYQFSPSRVSSGICHGWANAFAGVAYKRGWFDQQIFNYSGAPDGCKLHDDVWISGYLYRKNIVPYVIRTGFKTDLEHFRHPSLSINSVKNTEKDYRDPCIEHFQYFKPPQ
ncbi:hypothetical protein EDD86DRAFT_191694 [Gorgonomyces haynaldii]|nr:hypothetical protein EDD86DRAFT_191694 [Gorgonomyces haynaldii]